MDKRISKAVAKEIAKEFEPMCGLLSKGFSELNRSIQAFGAD